MQNPNEDTEWNAVLREKGILPPREDREVTIDEDTVVQVSWVGRGREGRGGRIGRKGSVY